MRLNDLLAKPAGRLEKEDCDQLLSYLLVGLAHMDVFGFTAIYRKSGVDVPGDWASRMATGVLVDDDLVPAALQFLAALRHNHREWFDTVLELGKLPLVTDKCSMKYLGVELLDAAGNVNIELAKIRPAEEKENGKGRKRAAGKHPEGQQKDRVPHGSRNIH